MYGYKGTTSIQRVSANPRWWWSECSQESGSDPFFLIFSLCRFSKRHDGNQWMEMMYWINWDQCTLYLSLLWSVVEFEHEGGPVQLVASYTMYAVTALLVTFRSWTFLSLLLYLLFVLFLFCLFVLIEISNLSRLFLLSFIFLFCSHCINLFRSLWSFLARSLLALLHVLAAISLLVSPFSPCSLHFAHIVSPFPCSPFFGYLGFSSSLLASSTCTFSSLSSALSLSGLAP